METGTYITQIGVQKESISHYPSQHKFKRFSQSNLPLAHPRTCHQSADTNCFRLMKKNFNQFVPQEYYECKKVKPGINFYRAILEGEQRKKNQPKMPTLKVNIPETLIISDNCFQLIHSQDKQVKIIEDINHLDYLQVIKKEESGGDQLADQGSYIQKQKNLYAASLLASGSGTYFDFSVYLSSQLDSRIYPKNQNQIAIKFTQPFNKAPNILRLYYTPKTIKGAKPNHGFKITNKNALCQELFCRKHKLVHNYLVDADKKDIVVTPVKGKALQELESMTQSIIDFLEYLRKVKITETVIDFTFGQDRKYYLHEIKSIKSVTLTKVWDVGEVEDIISLVKQKNSQIYCRLCGFLYCKAQMTHIVTNKLIIELIAHLRSRGQNIQIESSHMLSYHNQNSSHNNNLSNSSHVCSLCYELIIAEHQLIDLEHQFCRMLNMNSDPIERVPSMFSLQRANKINAIDVIKDILSVANNPHPKEIKNQENQNPHCPSNLFSNFLPTNTPDQASYERQEKEDQNGSVKPKSLYKWRLFFYIEKIKNIPNSLPNSNRVAIQRDSSLNQQNEEEYLEFQEEYELSLCFNDMKETFKGLTSVQSLFLQGDGKSRLSSTRVQSAASESIARSHSAMRYRNYHKNNIYFSKQQEKDRENFANNSQELALNSENQDKDNNSGSRNSLLFSSMKKNNERQPTRPMTSCPKISNKKPTCQTVFCKKTESFTRNSHPHIQYNMSFDCLDVRKVKVLVFYTTTSDIKNIFSNNDLKFELAKNRIKIDNRRNDKNQTNGHKFGHRKPMRTIQEVLRMKGESATLQNFTNREKCQRHSCQVLLFDQQFTYCNLQLNVGIICDGSIGNDHYGYQHAQKSSSQDRIYFPDKMQRNCTPLPQEWIQVLTDGVQQELGGQKIGEEEPARKEISYPLHKRKALKLNRQSMGTTNSESRVIRPLTGVSGATAVTKATHNGQWNMKQLNQWEEGRRNGCGYMRENKEEQIWEEEQYL